MPFSLVVLCLTSCLIVVTAWPLEEHQEIRGLNLLTGLRVGHPIFSFSRTTTTLTETYVTTKWLPSVVCAKLVNVTGSCKQESQQGRIVDIEEPVVMTFDDDTDEADALMQINPTMTLKIEPTSLMYDLESRATMRLEASRKDTSNDPDDPLESRGIISQAVRNFFNVNQIDRTTVTEISTVSEPYTTKTVFIMNCTPASFTAFPICSKGPRKSSK